MKRLSLLVPTWMALACVALARQDESKVSMDEVRAAFARAKTAVATDLKVELGDELVLREVTPEELAARIAAENAPIFVAQGLDEASARAQAATVGTSSAQFIYAKFAWSTGEFLFVPKTIELNARAFEDPLLVKSPFLEAVMVHELVHAVDHRRFEFEGTLMHLRDRDAVSAFNAVLEGHAQLLARRVCAKHEWSEGFERMASVIGKLPKSADAQGAAARLMLEVQCTTLAASYVQGEVFLTALEKQGGEAAIERAFRAPPAEMELVYHPEWYLDPAARPKRDFDFDAALDRFGQRYPSESWTSTRATMTQDQFRVALSLLDAETIDQLVRTLKSTRTLVLQPVGAPESKMVVVSILDYGTYGDALLHVAASERLSKLKDESMKKGSVRIKTAEYAPIAEEERKGFLAHKSLAVGFQKLPIATAVVGRERLVVETVFSNEEVGDEEHLALIESVLDAALAAPRPAEKR